MILILYEAYHLRTIAVKNFRINELDETNLHSTGLDAITLLAEKGK